MALHLAGWNVVLDSDRADELSAFYERLLGWTRFKGEEYTVLVDLEQTGTPTWITIQQADDYTFRPFGPRRRRSSSKWRIWISTSRMWKKV